MTNNGVCILIKATAAINSYASSNHQLKKIQTGSRANDAIYTKSEVVEYILDLVGYDQNIPIYEKRILEPSFGNGNFLFPIIDRLINSWRKFKPHKSAFVSLKNSIRAVEIHKETFEKTHAELTQYLITYGISSDESRSLVNAWLNQGDYLLVSDMGTFDYIVGNPPYIRHELIPADDLKKYRKRYQTMRDKADLYVPFFEKSLSVLSPGGHLGFICSDRWMKNKYGRALRSFVAERYCLKNYIDMKHVLAFSSKVAIYPAITVMVNNRSQATRISHSHNLKNEALIKLATSSTATDFSFFNTNQCVFDSMTGTGDPWIFENSDYIKLIRRLEKSFPLLEEVGCKVGIGVTTGADDAYIGDFESLDVEPGRKLPLLMTKDIVTGEVNWSGKGVINPFEDSGKLVKLDEYPRLKSFIDERQEVISARYCAKRNPDNWYRTVDRISTDLLRRPKLLIPDIQSKGHVVYERGEFYPHHNLYYVISDRWDLRALQALLLSTIAYAFVRMYSTQIRGGYLRFQAQYLRRICVPDWKDVSLKLREELVFAGIQQDVDICDEVVAKLYKLSDMEFSMLKNIRNQF